MFARRVLVRITVFAGLLACGSSAQPEREGVADVFGRVTQAGGIVLSRSRVAIDCFNGAIAMKVPTDSNGLYSATLLASSDVMARTGGQIACRFGAPDSVNAKIRSERVIQFTPFGENHPVHAINLSEL